MEKLHHYPLSQILNLTLYQNHKSVNPNSATYRWQHLGTVIFQIRHFLAIPSILIIFATVRLLRKSHTNLKQIVRDIQPEKYLYFDSIGKTICILDNFSGCISFHNDTIKSEH